MFEVNIFYDFRINYSEKDPGQNAPKPWSHGDLTEPQLVYLQMGVNPKIGGGFYPPKWMVKIMVPNPIFEWMIWGETPLFLETSICLDG